MDLNLRTGDRVEVNVAGTWTPATAEYEVVTRSIDQQEVLGYSWLFRYDTPQPVGGVGNSSVAICSVRRENVDEYVRKVS